MPDRSHHPSRFPRSRQASHARRPRRRNRRRAAVLVTVAVLVPQLLLAGVLAVRLGVLPGGADRGTANAGAERPDEPLRLGDCVRREDTVGTRYVRVRCTDFRAYGNVIGVVKGSPTGTEACAADTDFFASQPAAVVCLRQLSGPHPGDPGRGGGVYRSGDCVTTDVTSGVSEVPCDSADVSEIVTERVRTVAECLVPAVRFATVEAGATRVLCLRDGPGMAGPGECVTGPDTAVTFTAVPCTGPEAGARVVARVATPPACRTFPGQTHYVEDPSGLVRSRVVCLARLPGPR